MSDRDILALAKQITDMKNKSNDQELNMTIPTGVKSMSFEFGSGNMNKDKKKLSKRDKKELKALKKQDKKRAKQMQKLQKNI